MFVGPILNQIKRDLWENARHPAGLVLVLSWLKFALMRPALAIALLPLLFLSGEAFAMGHKPPYPACDADLPEQVSQAAVQDWNVKSPYMGILISQSELAALPTSGPAWEALKKAADRDPGWPNVRDQDNDNDVYTLAEALVYARTGDETYRERVFENITHAIGTEAGGRTLAVSRNIVSYVLAADLVNLPDEPEVDLAFRDWLRELLTKDLDGRTLRNTQEERPNNWGTHAAASRTAIALYLGDRDELNRTALVFRGYLGETSAYSNFIYGDDLSWQCDPLRPVGINPKGCVKDGHLLDGAQPEEMRRGASFRWPPAKTGYAWEGLQGALVTAELLSRAGYPAWVWQDSALLRAVNFLYGIGWEPERDDKGFVWLINHAYGTHFKAVVPERPGKNIGWLEWLYSRPAAKPDTPPSGRYVCW